MPVTLCTCSDTGESRQIFEVQVRDRLGRAGRFGRGARKLLLVFRLATPNRALRRTENPRVGGSIPPLATIPTFLKRNGFPASPADYRGQRGRKIDRPSDFVILGLSRGSAARCGRRSGELETWNSGIRQRGE
jgi:hypothetical protein